MDQEASFTILTVRGIKVGYERIHRSVNKRRKESFYSLFQGGKGQRHGVALALEVQGLSLLLSLRSKFQERGGALTSILVSSSIWAGCSLKDVVCLGICNFLSSVIFQSLGV